MNPFFKPPVWQAPTLLCAFCLFCHQDFPEEDLNRHYQQEHPDRMMQWVRISRILSQNGLSFLYHCAICRSGSDSVDAVLRHARGYHEEGQKQKQVIALEKGALDLLKHEWKQEKKHKQKQEKKQDLY